MHLRLWALGGSARRGTSTDCRRGGHLPTPRAVVDTAATGGFALGVGVDTIVQGGAGTAVVRLDSPRQSNSCAAPYFR
jgi:hypothetical protein